MLLRLLFAQLLLQLLRAFDQRLQHLARHRAGDDQGAGWMRLAIRADRRAFDAQDATMERDVRDAVDEETVVDSCKSENSARTEDQREYIFPSPYSGHPFSPSTRKCIIQPTSSKPISIFGFANTMSKGHIRVARAAAKPR